jgi:hypothetical protein
VNYFKRHTEPFNISDSMMILGLFQSARRGL